MANIEVLRVLAMMMVVMLHCLAKGMVLPELTQRFGAGGYTAWGLETLSIVAVNVYMLISGFFMVESEFRIRRVLRLICQVMFYSVLVPVVLVLCGVMSPSELTVYDLLRYLLPTQMIHYWFASAYIITCLFAPVINAAVKNMTQKQHKTVIILLLGLFSVSKSVLPVRLELDNNGYDALWFLCVYLIAAYMRLYGIPFLDRAWKGFACYFLGCAGILSVTFAVRGIYLMTGRMGDFVGAAYDYNHILNIFAAIGLFYGFYNWKPAENGFLTFIVKIAPYTFGVYLLHEHLELRWRWPVWLGVTAAEQTPSELTAGHPFFLISYTVLCVFAVFAAGILVDMFRGFLFHAAGRLPASIWLNGMLDRVDGNMSGRRKKEM